MGVDEKTPILRDDTQNKTTKLTFRHFVIIPITVAFCVPNSMITYIVPEYIQNRLDTDRPDLLQNYTYDPCVSNKSGPLYEHYTYVQEEIAKWLNYYSLIRGIPAILTSLIWASYSDIIGRRLLMFVSIFGFFLKFVGLSLVIYFKAHFAFLLIGEAINGITGGFGLFLAVLFAYVADITDLGYKRTIGIVLAELTLGIAFTIVTLGTGYYIQSLGFLYSAVTGAAFACFAFGTTLIFLPETIHNKKSGSLQLIFTSIAEPVKFYFKQDSRLKQIKYLMLIVALLFYTTQGLNRGGIEALYQLGQPFCWSPTQLGWFGAARMGSLSLLGLGLIVVMKKVLADDTIAVISAALTVISYVVEGLAQTEAMLYTVPALSVLSLLPTPVIRSLMSHLTPVEKQGAVFASIGAVETACSMLGALTGNLVYSATLSIMNGFVFFILGGLTFISGIMLWIYRWVDRKYPEEHTKELFVN